MDKSKIYKVRKKLNLAFYRFYAGDLKAASKLYEEMVNEYDSMDAGSQKEIYNELNSLYSSLKESGKKLIHETGEGIRKFKEDKEGEGLSTQVQKIANALDLQHGKKIKEKKFKLPFNLKMGMSQRIKKNYVLIFLMRTNGSIMPKFLPIKDDMVYIKETGTYHSTTADYIGRYKNYPTIILPEWSLIPLSKEDHFKSAAEKGELALPQKVIINAAKLAQLKQSSPFAGKTVLWLMLLGVVVLYFVSKMLGVQ